jgi:hypothetical protein
MLRRSVLVDVELDAHIKSPPVSAKKRLRREIDQAKPVSAAR